MRKKEWVQQCDQIGQFFSILASFKIFRKPFLGESSPKLTKILGNFWNLKTTFRLLGHRGIHMGDFSLNYLFTLECSSCSCLCIQKFRTWKRILKSILIHSRTCTFASLNLNVNKFLPNYLKDFKHCWPVCHIEEPDSQAEEMYHLRTCITFTFQPSG